MTLDPQAVANTRQQLLTGGFCVVDGHLEPNFLEELRAWSDHVLGVTKHSKRWKYQGSDIHVSGLEHRSKRHPNLPAHAIVDRLIEQPGEWMRSLEIDDLRSGGVFQIISKQAGAPPLYWHQDWARWHDPVSLSPWPQQVFLNWYLTDTDVNNGCLRVIPGSHLKRLELHDHLVQAHEGGGYDVEEENEWMFCDHPEAIDVPVVAGQLLIADARLLHGTYANRSGHRRTLLLGWYYRASNLVPDSWDREVPQEILDRPACFPKGNEWHREPGEFLR